jgi:hypothetical protein
MGLLDSLFGRGSKSEAELQKQPGHAAAVVQTPPSTVSAELQPEIVAAIAASISCVMDTGASAKLADHSGNGGYAVKNDYTSSAWALTGRQKLMDARQFR